MAQPGTLVFGERVNEDFIRESSQNLPSIADVLGAHASYGFNEIAPFQLARLAIYRASSYLPGIASEPLNSEEWVNSEYFRDGLNFVEGMTRMYAFQLASEFDKRKAWEEVIERGPQGASGIAVGIAGSLFGGVPDPVNYFPVIGAASKVRIINKVSKFTRNYIKNPANALRTARVAGSAVAGGLDAGLATALITPLFVEERKTSQDDISAAAVITNIAIATGIGTGFGTVGNIMGRRLRHRTLMAAHQRSVGQIVDGKNVDVGIMVQKELAESPLVTKADGVENLRYDVATDAPVIRNADSIKAENDLKLIIAKQVPAEDITFTKTLDDARTNPEAFEDLDVEPIREKPAVRKVEAVPEAPEAAKPIKLEKTVPDVVVPDRVRAEIDRLPRVVREGIDVQKFKETTFKEEFKGEGGRFDIRSRTVLLEKGNTDPNAILHESLHSFTSKIDDKEFMIGWIRNSGRFAKDVQDDLVARVNAGQIRRFSPFAQENITIDLTNFFAKDVESDFRPRNISKELTTFFEGQFAEVRKVPEVPRVAETTQVPSERVEAEPTAEINRQVQEHLDTAERISKEVEQEQTLLADYIRCLTEV